jgi:hypothetical protein
LRADIRNRRLAEYEELAANNTYGVQVYQLLNGDSRRTSTFCRTCYDDLDGDRVWFYDVWAHRLTVYAICEPCFDDERARLVAKYPHLVEPRCCWDRLLGRGEQRGLLTVREIPCPGCQRTMVFGGFCRTIPACSDRCATLAHGARRRARLEAARADRVCEQCGATFDPPRSDARTCSPACRQKAYRARRRAVTDERCEPDQTAATRNAEDATSEQAWIEGRRRPPQLGDSLQIQLGKLLEERGKE